jgi:hypothetical protein
VVGGTSPVISHHCTASTRVTKQRLDTDLVPGVEAVRVRVDLLLHAAAGPSPHGRARHASSATVSR